MIGSSIVPRFPPFLFSIMTKTDNGCGDIGCTHHVGRKVEASYQRYRFPASSPRFRDVPDLSLVRDRWERCLVRLREGAGPPGI